MSASEALRRLDGPTPKAAIARADEINRRGRVLLNALPALIAVVEAAEAAEHEYEMCRIGADDGEFALWSEARLYSELHALAPALAALSRVLEGEER